LIKINKISKSYEKQKILNNLSFEIQKGEIIGLTGPNGAGKSTLLNILALLNMPDSGEYYINEKYVGENIDYFRSIVGYVPQEIALFDELTVLDNLLYWSKYSKKKAKLKAQEIGERLDLYDLFHKKIKKLSGGMKRRINLAVGLLNDPKILILDEPMVGIDEKHCKEIFFYLKELSQQGITQIISGHYAEQLMHIADRVLYIDEGEVQFFENVLLYTEFLLKKARSAQ
jgi:ABC-2 type transport system ATP-binding protein